MRRAALLRVATDLPTAEDRRDVVDVQAEVVIDLLAVVLDDRYLPTLVVGAKPGAVGHVDDLESHDWVAHHQRLRYDGAQSISIGAVRDTHVLSIDEAIRGHGVGWRVQWSCQPLQRVDLGAVVRRTVFDCERHANMLAFQLRRDERGSTRIVVW